MNNIKELDKSQPTLLQVAALYAQVFAGSPWYEKSKGLTCQKFYDKKPGESCPCGCGKLQPAYPETETVQYILNEISKPLAQALLAINTESNLPVAFGWGFQLTSEQFAQQKYSYDSRKFIQSVVPSDTYFYISEVGVNPTYQQQGLGKTITQALCDQKPFPLFMRTLETSSMAIIATKLGFTRILGKGTAYSDPENPNRVLFINTSYNK